jgi:hypothetical protein
VINPSFIHLPLTVVCLIVLFHSLVKIFRRSDQAIGQVLVAPTVACSKTKGENCVVGTLPII